MEDIIFAEATAPGRAGLSVIRISGKGCWARLMPVVGLTPEPRKAVLRQIRGHNDELLDEGLVICFPEGESFTGEETLELQLHGSRAVVSTVLVLLSTLDGLRPAKPGEFTRRALDNGKLDLTQVEGLADLINADTEAQRKQAMRSLRGELSTLATGWRGKLVKCSALLETTMDFADEEVPDDLSADVIALLDDVQRGMSDQVQGIDISERIRDGFEVAIVGRPNVGKSTLLNFLAGRKAAITSEIAGTTRDIIEVQMELGGLPVTLLDTAGLRNTDDNVESIGVDLAKERANAADLRVFLLLDSDQPEDFDIEISGDDIMAGAKADLEGSGKDLQISGVTGEGVERLVANVAQILKDRSATASTATNQRHASSMHKAIGALDSARLRLEGSTENTELVAEEIRFAILSLDELIGRVGVEDILDVVFREFCIGK